MTEFNQNFIRSMRKKYKGLLEPSKSPFDVMNGKEPGSGEFSRFTGMGADNRLQENKAAGVVHEGEQVLTAPTVRNLGGPEAINEMVTEAQANINLRPTKRDMRPDPNSFNRSGAQGRRKPGFQFGPGFNTTFDTQTGGARTVDPPPPAVDETGSSVGGSQDVQTAAPNVNGIQTAIRTDPSTLIAADDPQNVQTSFVPNAPTDVIQQTPRTEAVTVSRDAEGNVTSDSRVTSPPETPTDTVTDDLTDANTLLNEADVNVGRVTIPEAPTIGKSNRQLEAEGLIDQNIKELQKIADGKGTASTVLGDLARRQLSGKLAAGQMAGAQFAAQAGLTGGALNTFFAQQQRNKELAMTGLEGTLAADAVNRAENALFAIGQMAINNRDFEARSAEFAAQLGLSYDQLGMDAEKSNIMAEQFEETTKIALANFKHNVELDGVDVALRKLMADHTILSSNAQTLLALDTPAGYEAAGNIYEKMGIDVDMTSLVDNANAEQFATNIANGLDNMELAPDDMVWSEGGQLTEAAWNQAATRDFVKAYNDQFGTDYDVQNIQNDSAAMEWLNNTINVQATKGSYAYQAAQDMTADEAWGLFSNIPSTDANGNLLDVEGNIVTNPADAASRYASPDDFTWAGKTGMDAVFLAVGNLILTGGLGENPDGTVNMDNNIASEVLFGNNPNSIGSTSDGTASTGTGAGSTELPSEIAGLLNANEELRTQAGTLGISANDLASKVDNIQDAQRYIEDSGFRTFIDAEGRADLPSGVTFDQVQQKAIKLAGTGDPIQFIGEAITHFNDIPTEPGTFVSINTDSFADANIAQQNGSVETYENVNSLQSIMGKELATWEEKRGNNFIELDNSVYRVVNDGGDNRYVSEAEGRSAFHGAATGDKHKDYIHLINEEGNNFWVSNDGTTWLRQPNEFVPTDKQTTGTSNDLSDLSSKSLDVIDKLYRIDTPITSAEDKAILNEYLTLADNIWAGYQADQFSKSSANSLPSFEDYLTRRKAGESDQDIYGKFLNRG